MSEKLRIGRTDGLGTSFSVARILVALKVVASAIDVTPLELPEKAFSNDHGKANTDFGAVDAFVADLRLMITKVVQDKGSLTVRFLGDLKSSIYPLETQFFHQSGNTSNGDEFTSILQKALLGGVSEELVFINLANVRDVRINLGKGKPLGTSSDLSYLSSMADTFESWACDAAPITIFTEN